MAGRQGGGGNGSWLVKWPVKQKATPSQSGREIILAERCHLLGKFFAFCGIALKKNYALCGTGERERITAHSLPFLQFILPAFLHSSSPASAPFPCPVCLLIHLPVDRPAGPLFPARNQQLSKLTAQPDWTEPRPHRVLARSCSSPILARFFLNCQLQLAFNKI